MSNNTDNFQWTDALATELCEYVGMRVGKATDIRQQVSLLVEDFKQSKTTPSNVVEGKRDWEIVAAKGKSSGNVYTLSENGIYLDRNNNGFGASKDGIGIIDDPSLEIHSVKRLSDGVVFTVGEVHGAVSYNNREIQSFYVDHDNEMIIVQSGGISKLKELRKALTPSIKEDTPVKERITGLIGVNIKGNVVDYKNSASINIGEDGKPKAIGMDGIIFLPEAVLNEDTVVDKAEETFGVRLTVGDFMIMKRMIDDKKNPPQETISTNNDDVACLSLNDLLDCFYTWEELKQQNLAHCAGHARQDLKNNHPLYKRFKEKIKEKLKQ